MRSRGLCGLPRAMASTAIATRWRTGPAAPILPTILGLFPQSEDILLGCEMPRTLGKVPFKRDSGHSWLLRVLLSDSVPTTASKNPQVGYPSAQSVRGSS